MAQTTEALLLDETAQRIADSLDVLAEEQKAIQRMWSNISDSSLAQLRTDVDAGNVNLASDYGWTEGDERDVTLTDGSTITLVLLENTSNHFKFSDDNPANFVVAMKNCYGTTKPMNSTNTNAGSWESSLMKTWLNGTFYDMLPSGLQSFLKSFKVLTATEYNASTNRTSTQKLALFAEKEVFGSKTYSTDTEANALIQLDYFKTSSNRIKTVNGSASNWWLRSPIYSNAIHFCRVSSNDSSYFNDASGSLGVLAFGCI